MQILDAARESARTGKAVRLARLPDGSEDSGLHAPK